MIARSSACRLRRARQRRPPHSDADAEVAARFARHVGAQSILSVGYADPANISARIALVNPEVVTPARICVSCRC